MSTGPRPRPRPRPTNVVSLNPAHHIDWKGFRNSRYASDSHGHAARIQFRIQPSVQRIMSELVREFGSEYKEIGDLVRHAVREHITRLQGYREIQQNDRVTSTMAQVDSMLDILAAEEEQANFTQVINRTADVINQMFSIGAHAEVAGLLRDLRENIRQMSSPFWRAKYLEELRSRFGHMESGMKGHSLVAVDPED